MDDMTRALNVLTSMRRNDAVGTGVCGDVAFGRTKSWSPPQQLPKARVLSVDDFLKQGGR